MASSSVEQPSAKRPYLEESNGDYKTIQLDMSKYGDWVRQLSPEGLVSVFDLGVKVKESAILTVDVSKSVLENTFSSHLKQVQDHVTKDMKECKEKLDKISNSLTKPGVKGDLGEMTVQAIIKRRFPNFSTLDVSRSGEKGKGDINVETTTGHRILIEVKKHKASVPPKESKSFEDGLASSPEFKVGILFSLDSGISNHSPAGDFEVAFDQSKNQYRIYVPNAMKDSDENRVVWSVLMAEQLAGMHGVLTDSQVQGLEKICDEFRKDVEHSKRCEDSLKSLENALSNLKEELVPFLKTVQKTKEKLDNLLRHDQ